MIQFILDRPFDQVDHEKQHRLKGKQPLADEAFGSDPVAVEKIMVVDCFFKLLDKGGTQIARIVTL
jgi:hypothetical protein